MTDVDAVVWVADGQAAEGLSYGDRLVERLTGLDLRVVTRDLTTATGNEAVPSTRVHILSGGSTSVNDRSGWMPRGLGLTHSLIEAAQREEHSVVGICLGSQMIAEALWPGRRTVRAAQQIEVGLTTVRWRDEKRHGESEQIVVPAFHYEELDPNPMLEGNAQVVADNDHSPVQGFRYGPRIWGFQFHPEFEPADVRRLVLHHRSTIENYHGDTQAALRSVDRYESAWTNTWFDQFIHRVMQHSR